MKIKRVEIVAVDGGPRQVMQHLASHLSDSVIIHNNIISLETCDLLLVGTSGSIKGRAVEMTMRRLAVELSVSLVIIEDYPGNFRRELDGMPDLLIVEHEFIAELYRFQLAECCPDIVVFPNPRYDQLRMNFKKMENRLQKLWRASGYVPSILWAGQPETEDSLATLERLLPDIEGTQTLLLFKAHPRDEGYHDGRYWELLNRFDIHYLDVTDMNLEECYLLYAPLAILTQFSSLAIEAGFYGIPSVHVLYRDVGYKRLMNDKGYGIPPWCLSGASVFICDPLEQRSQLLKLINDKIFRDHMSACFCDYWNETPAGSSVFSYIMRTIGRGD